ncbi:MAG: hypothetical protein F4X64_00240 [Chloroflexi bacterium]|nr:hypothetical protein [Chloroflexota bacterium]
MSFHDFVDDPGDAIGAGIGDIAYDLCQLPAGEIKPKIAQKPIGFLQIRFAFLNQPQPMIRTDQFRNALAVRHKKAIYSSGAAWPSGVCGVGDEIGRELRDDRVSDGAQLSHSGGNPMSQRLNAEFNEPEAPFVVSDWNSSGPRIPFENSAA